MPLPKIKESDFQKQVIEFAQLKGWRCAHFRKVRVQRGNGATYWETPVAADGKGFLDLVCVREKVLFIEVKTDDGRLTPEQRAWIDALEAAGQEVRVYRPEDWPQIEKELSDG